jgi:hypothetical protein
LYANSGLGADCCLFVEVIKQHPTNNMMRHGERVSRSAEEPAELKITGPYE